MTDEQVVIYEDSEYYGTIKFREIHLISTNKVLSTIMASLLKKYNADYTSDVNKWVVKRHDKGLIELLVEKLDIYPRYCVYINRKTQETYNILYFQLD